MIYSTFEFGDITAVYYVEDDTYSFMLVPSGMEKEIKESKLSLADSMIQLCVNGEAAGMGYISGASYHNASNLLELKLVKQYTEDMGNNISVITEFSGKNGIYCTHRLVGGRGYVRCSVSVRNDGAESFDIYDLPSFSLNGITPFSDGAAYGDLCLHRFTSFWSAEGRHQCETLEELNFEPGWTGGSCKTLRISQVGTMPVRGYFPFMAVEDTLAGVVWAAQLEHCGSWQMELFRQRDNLVICGGLADYLTGHWFKRLEPGEELHSPEAILTAVKGNIDDACDALLQAQEDALVVIGAEEEELCPLYNEYCDTWNDPTVESIRGELESISGWGLKYFVIDAGWNGRSDIFCTENNGDWYPDPQRFPNGMKEISEMIRSYGMVPGLWFEPEVASIISKYYAAHKEEFVKLNGRPVIHAGRAFFDMSTDIARDFMKKYVIDFLRDNGFGYIKIDYNDHIGLGFDGYESIGEGIRQCAEGIYRFFDDMRVELPDLIIENCASGGHRLEPGMMRRSSMASFSDAHECVDIPLIAADLQRLILPRQSQIWAVIRKEDSERRIVYSCVNTLLGRMCISGNVAQLTEEQRNVLRDGIEFYKQAAPVIKNGISRCVREGVTTYREPQGWQTVVRCNEEQALVILNVFKISDDDTPYTVTIQDERIKDIKINAFYAEAGCRVQITENELQVTVNGNFSGVGILLQL